MHKLAEKIADCMKAKVEAKGIDNIEGQDLVELGMWTDIIKDLVCYDKDKRIIEAMDEAEESEEAMKYIDMYHDYTPEMLRDMDREEMGRMYYSVSGSQGGMYSGMSGGSMGGSRGYESGIGQSSRSENARRGYEESKMMQDGSPESKKKAMENLENYLKELSEDMTELVGKMDSNEKSMVKNKLQVLAQKVQ